ncbi:hypothetical protein PHMEG_0006441 [Phytophthora megakarya]|uniref:Reverse transcriptase RNase H-like domain-containing protein n=1 Tax=Phytophthora megakarya TaxID=4795 RepID=A0A225WPS0_9STRA|nr:hypothetical protein PHMEG_0006441 [Phytophthora megakarya]
MRDSLDYARAVQPLQQCLDMALNGKRKRSMLHRELFLNQVKMLLQKSAQLAHARDDATFCLFVDASDVGWAPILTQVATWKTGVAVTDQVHELLIFKALEMIEKEGYPILLSCEDLDYILLRPGGFKIFCDHLNLIHVFAPGQEIKKHVRGKLLRWSVKLMEFCYTIVHVEGTNNLWADLISRRGGSSAVTTTVSKRVTRFQNRAKRRPLLRPLNKDGLSGRL